MGYRKHDISVPWRWRYKAWQTYTNMERHYWRTKQPWNGLKPFKNPFVFEFEFSSCSPWLKLKTIQNGLPSCSVSSKSCFEIDNFLRRERFETRFSRATLATCYAVAFLFLRRKLDSLLAFARCRTGLFKLIYNLLYTAVYRI